MEPVTSTPPISNQQQPDSAPSDGSSSIEPQPNIVAERKRTSGPPYICECGYDAKRKKARLTNHQQEGHCHLYQRTAPLIPCPVYSKTFTYGGLKSHLLPFTKPSIRGTYSEEHAMVNIEKHKQHYEEVKSKFAPKKRKERLV